MTPLRLRTSLTLWYVGVLAVVLTALGVAFHLVLLRQLDTAATDALNEKARALHGYLRFPNGRPALVFDADDPEEVAFINDATRYYQVFDASNGRLLAQSPGLEALGLHYTPQEIFELGTESRLLDIETDAGRLRLTSSAIAPSPGESYIVQVGEVLTAIDGTLARFDQMLWLRIVMGIAVAALLGPWLAKRSLAPVAQLAAITRTIGIANLDHRVPARGVGDELDQLADAFNHTLERLEASVGDMRQFSAALAHELRTPLAILRGEAELELAHPLSPDARRDRLISQIEECDRLTRLINQILTLARAEAGEIRLASESVALGALATAVSEQMEPVASARNITLTCEAAADAFVAGDHGWLERLILILLDNAIKFTSDAGYVTIRVSPSSERVLLEVVDSGMGIAPDEIPRLFRRFYRTHSATSKKIPGSGLGLALAKWIVDRHGATIAVTSHPGSGTTFAVTFRALVTAPATLSGDSQPSTPILKAT